MMGRIVGRTNDAEQEPSIAAADEAIAGGKDIRPQHISQPSCWCHPTEVEPGLWLHHPLPGELPLINREPWLEGYVVDIKGHIEGDDA